MSMVQINFNFVAPFEVIMWRIDLTSKQESHVGTYQFGVITQFALPGTEWRFTEMGHPRPFQTYVTTDAPMQHVEVGKIVSSHPGAVPVTDSPVTLGVPITGPLRTPVTPAVTVTVTPGVVVTGTLSNPSISVGSTTPPAGGSPLVGAKDSIFNSESFDKNVIDLEYAIRQQSGLTDKNQRRAAVYAAMMAIARAQNRTSKEQAVMDWLAGQVKKTRIDAARLALEEYDRWTSDPWSYHPPQGYDFTSVPNCTSEFTPVAVEHP